MNIIYNNFWLNIGKKAVDIKLKKKKWFVEVILSKSTRKKALQAILYEKIIFYRQPQILKRFYNNNKLYNNNKKKLW